MKTITIKTIKWLKPVIIPKEKHKISETTLVYFKALQKTALFLITGAAINTASAQVVYSKLGEKPGDLNSSAVLELESTSRGFLLPRMKKKDRDAISVSDDAVGLQVWCKDCNTSTSPKSGQLCVYLGKDKGGWIPFTMNTTSVLTTNLPTKVSNSVTVNGTLTELVGAKPTKTGVVYREIINNDFATLPVLDSLGNAVAAHTYEKHTDTAVTEANRLITVPVPDLTSANPYYFRTYAKSPSGISYGNAVIFNLAPPKISASDVTSTNENTLLPVFKGKLTVNAGTPQDAITEYGYYSGATDPPPTATDNKVVLSATGTGSLTLDLLNEKLNSETFTANPAVSLLVNDYNVKSLSKTYFRYYAIVKGETEPVYSNVVSFTPVADPVTGGTAVAVLGITEPISKPLKAGENSTSSFKVHFKVTKAGSYSFTPEASTGATQGLTMPAVSGNFDATPTDQTVTFTINGFPKTSLDGCSFVVPRIGTLSTGAIQQFDSTTPIAVVSDGNALCDATHTTIVNPVFSLKTGRVWMDRNLGASQAKTSTSADDYKAYGCLYQWGRGNDGHASMTWTINSSGVISGVALAPFVARETTAPTSDTPGGSFFHDVNPPWDWSSAIKDYLWQGNSGINNPCPSGYHVPAKVEFQAEIDADALVSVLKFVRTPVRTQDDRIRAEQSEMWSSTVDTNSIRSSYYLVIGDNMSMSMDSQPPRRGDGFAVRCIKNL